MRGTRLLTAGLLLALLAGVVMAAHDGDAPALVSTTPVRTLPVAMAVDPRSGHAFVANSGDDSVSVLDAHSGRLLRTVAVVAAPTTVLVDGRIGRAFVAGSTGLSVLDTVSGARVRPRVSLPDTGAPTGYAHDVTVRAVAVDERTGHVFVSVSGYRRVGWVSMLDARSGAVLRSVRVGWQPDALAVDARTDRVFVANLADGTLSVLDATSGRLLRAVAVGTNPTAVAVDEQTGHAFVANNSDGTVSVLDARSGVALRTVVVSSPMSVVVDAGTRRVIVADGFSGSVSVLDARSGAVLRTSVAGVAAPEAGDFVGAGAVVVDARRGHVFAVAGTRTAARGSVLMLDATSGHLLRRLPVGLAPVALALDETMGRLFVVNMRGEGSARAGMPNLWGWVPRGLRRWIAWLPQPAPPTSTGSVTVLDVARV
jgi:YVTN family beta-propeller protein